VEGMRKNTEISVRVVGVQVSFEVVKGEVFSVHAMKAYKGSRSITPLIFNVGTMCRMSQQEFHHRKLFLHPCFKGKCNVTSALEKLVCT
jgi:hypothetical protein